MNSILVLHIQLRPVGKSRKNPIHSFNKWRDVIVRGVPSAMETSMMCLFKNCQLQSTIKIHVTRAIGDTLTK